MYERRLVGLSLIVLVVSAAFNPAVAQRAKWTVETLRLPSSATRLFKDANGVNIATRKSGWFALGKCGSRLCATALKKTIPRPRLPSGALPDAEVVLGKRNIRSAWLAQPTRRYGHAVLGDAIEAGRVVAEDAQGVRHVLTLPENAVFEDRFVRLADLDADGRDEIIVVKSYLDVGAALAVLSLGADGLRTIAETRPVGRAHRWLNPAGIADYDGDGRNDIALVITPHIGGRLEFWDYRGGALRRKFHRNGFSNHVIGSRVQQMSVSADFNSDGIPELALPSQDRKALSVISLAGGAVNTIAHIALPGAVVTEILDISGPGSLRPELVMGLENGLLARVH